MQLRRGVLLSAVQILVVDRPRPFNFVQLEREDQATVPLFGYGDHALR